MTSKLKNSIKRTRFVEKKEIQFGPHKAIITCNVYGEFGFYPQWDFEPDEETNLYYMCEPDYYEEGAHIPTDNTTLAQLYREAIYKLYEDWFSKTEINLMNKADSLAKKYNATENMVHDLICTYERQEDEIVFPELFK